jgi:hypothetical protein
MLKATKRTLAAALLAGSCGLAMAQATGGAAEGKPGGSDAAPPASTAAQPKAGQTGAPMMQKNTGMPTKAQDAGQETGTAKDSAGPGQMREESKHEQIKK